MSDTIPVEIWQFFVPKEWPAILIKLGKGTKKSTIQLLASWNTLKKATEDLQIIRADNRLSLLRALVASAVTDNLPDWSRLKLEITGKKWEKIVDFWIEIGTDMKMYDGN